MATAQPRDARRGIARKESSVRALRSPAAQESARPAVEGRHPMNAPSRQNCRTQRGRDDQRQGPTTTWRAKGGGGAARKTKECVPYVPRSKHNLDRPPGRTRGPPEATGTEAESPSDTEGWTMSSSVPLQTWRPKSPGTPPPPTAVSPVAASGHPPARGPPSLATFPEAPQGSGPPPGTTDGLPPDCSVWPQSRNRG